MKWHWLLIPFLFLGCGPKQTAVRIELPLPPKLDLAQYTEVYFPGFMTEVRNPEFDSIRETMNYFKREFARRDVVDVLDLPPLDFSDKDPRTFFEQTQPLFTQLGLERPEKTLIITGIVNYEVVDRSSFRQVQREYRGQPYYRTQFVEATGYLLRMRVYVYEVSEGKMIYREVLQDEIDVEGAPGDTKLAFFNLLERISARILGLFSHTNVKAERTLL